MYMLNVSDSRDTGQQRKCWKDEFDGLKVHSLDLSLVGRNTRLVSI